MITEDYVSFEVARLLKEKGFNEECPQNGYYVINRYSTGPYWNLIVYNVGDVSFEYSKDNTISRPTLQMAMKWLREVHNIHIEVAPAVDDTTFSYYWHCYADNLKQRYPFSQFIGDALTYEDGIEKVLRYSLESLI